MANLIHRLHVTSVGDRLVFGDDYDDVDHQYGDTREVCFNAGDWDVSEDNVVHIEYEREKDVDDLPPMLIEIERVEIIEETATPDFLLDL